MSFNPLEDAGYRLKTNSAVAEQEAARSRVKKPFSGVKREKPLPFRRKTPVLKLAVRK
ncbi:MAG: hypothetical protein AAB388_00090 [Patescibacteria group bacterium]